MKMTPSQAASKASSIFNSKPNGREKGYKESIYWGVAKPYADLKDCRAAGIKINKKKVSPGGVYYYITQAECKKLLEWINW